MNNERVSYLLKRYLDNDISPLEWQELKDRLLQGKSVTAFQETLDALIESSPVIPDYEEAAWENMYRKIREANTKTRSSGQGGVVRLPEKRTWIAAAILIFLVTGSWLLLFRHQPIKPIKERTRMMSLRQPSANDVAPGGNKAILTLADGSRIDLNAAGNGPLGQQGNSRVIKLNGGQLAYEAAASLKPAAANEPAYNTIATPRGGEYQVILPDGSKVWLNAASSLRYPTAFSGKERVVELNGEAYFEVAPMAHQSGRVGMPFRVHIIPPSDGPEMDVRVLGTHFNVMAYPDERSINTTLLEGSVKLSSGNKEVLIRPGEQGKLNTGHDFKVAPADTDEVMAWKNGLFRFNEATIEEVMRQVSRWYDVEVVYVNEAPKDLFRGEIYRNVSVSKVLKVLEASGVHFTVEGKKILVRS